MTVLLAALLGFIAGLSLREIVRFWSAAATRLRAPAPQPNHWDQVHLAGDRRPPLRRQR